MGSIIKTVSIPDRHKDKLNELEERLELKNQSFSNFVSEKILEVFEEKSESNLTLNSEFDEIQKFAREMKLEELKKISHKANVMMLTIEAFIKWDSYEGDKTKKRFQNPREAERYLRG